MAESPAHKFGHRKYEVLIEFSTGDKIDASFDSKQRVREFLNLVTV